MADVPLVKPQLGARRTFLLGALTLGHAAVHWYQQFFPVILPAIKADLGLNDVQVGGLATAREFGTGALMLPAGLVADMFVKQRPLIMASALACGGVAYLLVGLSPSYIWALPAMLLVGLAAATWHPASVSSLSARFSERRGTALAIHGVGASVGDTVSPLCVGALLLLISWRPLMGFHLLPALVLALLLWRSLGPFYGGEGPGPSLRSYFGGIVDMVRQPSVIGVAIANSLMGMVRLSVLTFLPIYLTEELNYSSFALGFYIMLLYLMGMVSQPVMGVISDRLGRKAVLLPSFATLGLLFLVLPLADAGVQLGLVIGAIGLFFYATGNIALAAVMDVSGAQVHGSVMSVLSVFRQVFVLPSPIIAGFIVTGYGTGASFYYASALLLIATLVLLAVPSSPRSAAPKT